MITVRLRRNTRIANPVTLLIVPLNYIEYIDSGFVQPLDFPEVPPENLFTSNRAKSKTYTSIAVFVQYATQNINLPQVSHWTGEISILHP